MGSRQRGERRVKTRGLQWLGNQTACATHKEGQGRIEGCAKG
jgi:hypothetical protein